MQQNVQQNYKCKQHRNSMSLGFSDTAAVHVAEMRFLSDDEVWDTAEFWKDGQVDKTF